jgi:hypothetical protein
MHQLFPGWAGAQSGDAKIRGALRGAVEALREALSGGRKRKARACACTSWGLALLLSA